MQKYIIKNEIVFVSCVRKQSPSITPHSEHMLFWAFMFCTWCAECVALSYICTGFDFIWIKGTHSYVPLWAEVVAFISSLYL